MKVKKLMILSLLLAAGIFLRGDSAFAATKNWVGTACTNSSDCDWSNTANWQGGSAPTNGDDIVINGNTSTSSSTIQDIANLTVASITTSGYDPDTSGNGQAWIHNTAGLTITGPVTHNAASSPAPSGYTIQDLLPLDGAVTLGANSVLTNVYLGDSSGVLTLGGYIATYRVTSIYVGTTLNFGVRVTGNGTLTVEIPATTAFFMNNANDYSGTTNLTTLNYATTIDGLTTAFGSSTINISPNSRILFEADGQVTINNPINISPPETEGTFLANQIEFWSSTAAVVYTVPHITLLGNARFGIVDNVNRPVQVNLAGITTNGHCLQYDTDNNRVANFLNGPAACIVNVAKQTPKVPNTGFGLLLNNPALIAGVTLASAVTLTVIARRMKPATKRVRR